MNVTDERSSEKFKYISDGVPFEDDGDLYIKLNRLVKDTEDNSHYNAVALESGALVFFNDDYYVKLPNAEVVIR